MVAVDHGELAAVREGMGDADLLGVGHARIFLAGVHRAKHNVRAQVPGPLRLGDHDLGVEHVHLPGRLRELSVQAVGRTDHGDLRRRGLQDQDALGVGCAPVGPCVLQPGGVEGIQGADQPGGAAVDGVVARGGAGLVADLLDGRDDLWRNVERGVRGKRSGRAGDGCLQVADGEVTLLDVPALTLQQRPEVQALGAGGQGIRAGLLPELGVDQHVPRDHYRGAADGRAAGPLARRRRRGRARGTRLRRSRALHRGRSGGAPCVRRGA